MLESDENVSELIEKPAQIRVKPATYVSKYRNSVKLESFGRKSGHKTFGLAKLSLNTPKNFLRKHSRIETKKIDVKHSHYRKPNYQHKLPSWKPLKKTSDDVDKQMKNFKKENIIKISTSEPRKPKLYYVDDRHGNTFPPKPIRMNPNGKDDLSKKKKGKLTMGKVESDKKMNENGKVLTKTEKKHQLTSVSEEERLQLLHGMKKKWEEMMKQFQGLPFLIDTPSKVRRKAKLEEELKQLEKDIDMIERHPYIYVYSDGEE